MDAFNIGKKAVLKLMAGDVIVLFLSLILSIILRSGVLPVWYTIRLNIYVFSPVFVLWLIGFFFF